MKLSESSVYQKAQENPGFVIIPNHVEGFFKCFDGDIPIWTTNYTEAFRFFNPIYDPLQHPLIEKLAKQGYPCSLHYYWEALEREFKI